MTPPDYDLKEINTREEDLGVDGPKVKSVVPLTQVDESDMYRLGKQQDLNVCLEVPHPSFPQITDLTQRNFRFISIMGFAVVLMGTWEGQLR